MIKTPRVDRYQEVFQKTIHRNICFFAHWELTYRCNLKCRHCYIAPLAQKKELSHTKALHIIDELKKMNCLYLCLSGGEILCRDDFFDIASYARAQGFALRLLTNGTLINKDSASRIAQLHPLAVDISIYAASAALHDKITRVKGSFTRALSAAKLLKGCHLAVNFKFLVMKDNAREYKKVRQLAKSLRIPLLYDPCVITKDNGSKGPLRWRLHKAELKEFFRETAVSSPQKREAEDRSVLCNAGLNNIFISPYLDVYPCIGLKIKLGNLYKEGLGRIWQCSPKLQRLRQLKDSDLLECSQCRFTQYCFRCPGIALVENKDLLGPSRFDCTVAKALYETYEKGRNTYAAQ